MIIMADTHTNKGNQGQSFGTTSKGGQHQNQGQQGGQGNANRGAQGGQNQDQHQSNQGTMAGVAQSVKDAASTATRTVTDQAQHAAENIGGGMKSFAGTIREHAPEGMLGTAAGSVAQTLE